MMVSSEKVFSIFESPLLNEWLQGIPMFVRPEYLSGYLLHQAKLLWSDVVLWTVKTVVQVRNDTLHQDVSYDRYL